MKTFKYILTLFIAVIVMSCYEDKGNYIYDESIYDISVKLKSSYGLRKVGDLIQYTITPEIETVDGDKSYLEYLWIMRNNKTGMEDTLCLTEQADIEIDPNASDYSNSYDLLFYVTDTKTGGLTMVPTKIELIAPYSYAWAILHEVDEHAELGTVEYVGSDMVVVADAYTQERKKSLSGKPINLSVVKNNISSSYWFGSECPAQLYLTTTVPEESGWYEQSTHFELMGSWSELIWYTLAGEFDPENMQTSGDDLGLLVASKGNVFRSCANSPVLFKAIPSSTSTLEGDYYITKCLGGPNVCLAYDELGHRFVTILAGWQYSWYSYPYYEQAGGDITPLRNAVDNAADPNNLPEGEKVINLINGYYYDRANPLANWQRYSAYAYSLGNDGKSHVYVFRYYNIASGGEGEPPMPYLFTFDTPEGINENTPMTSSWEYNNILFYAVGNKVFKLDFAAGQSTLIYTHPDNAAEIVDLKMAIEGYVDAGDFGDSSLYGHPYSRCLGVAVNTSDGKGELVVLQLNSAGKVDSDKKFPSVQEHKGFGKITEIAFF